MLRRLHAHPSMTGPRVTIIKYVITAMVRQQLEALITIQARTGSRQTGLMGPIQGVTPTETSIQATAIQDFIPTMARAVRALVLAPLGLATNKLILPVCVG